jgi:hypothetical protein
VIGEGDAAGPHLFGVEAGFPVIFDPAGEAAVQDPGGHRDPELGVADEEHAGLEVRRTPKIGPVAKL